MHLLPNIIYWFKSNKVGFTQKNINFDRKNSSYTLSDTEDHIPVHKLQNIYTKPFKSKRDLVEAKMIIVDLLKGNAKTRNQYKKLCNKLTIIPKVFF